MFARNGGDNSERASPHGWWLMLQVLVARVTRGGTSKASLGTRFRSREIGTVVEKSTSRTFGVTYLLSRPRRLSKGDGRSKTYAGYE